MKSGIHLATPAHQAWRDERGSQRVQEARVAPHEPGAERALLCGRCLRVQGVLQRAFLELPADAPAQHRKAGASPGSPPILFLPSLLLSSFSSSFLLFPLPSSLLIRRNPCADIFGFGVGGCFGAVGSWVVGWGFVVVGGFVLWRVGGFVWA